MGNQNSVLKYHSLYCSPTVSLTDDNEVATFPPYSRDSVSYLSKPVSRMTRERKFGIKVKFAVVSGCACVGFRSKRELGGAPLASCPDVTLWDVTNGTLIIGGRVRGQIGLPKCRSGAVCHCTIDTGTEIVNCTVRNKGADPVTKEVSVGGLPHEIWPFVGVLSSGSEQVSIQLIPLNQELEDDLTDLTAETVFDVSSARGLLTVSRDGKVVQRSSDQHGNSCVLVSRVMTHGRHRWTLLVKIDFGASVCLGLARVPFELSKEYLDDENKCIYRHQRLLVWRSYRGLLYVDGTQLEHSLEPLGWQHSRSVQVEFHLDLHAGTLEVVRNRKTLGIAFRGISGPVQPIVAFYAAYEKEVELVEYRTSEDYSVAIAKTIPCSEFDLAKPQPPSLVSTAKFSPASKYGDIGVTSDGASIFRNNTQSGNAYCPLNIQCTYGEYRFSFVIEIDQGASTCVGVAKVNFHLKGSENIYKSEGLYLYRSFQGMLYSEGKELQRRLVEFWSSGTLVEMVLVIKGNEGNVQFVVNGVDQGVAFTELRPPLVPVVAFYSGMQKRVTLIHFEHTLGSQKSTTVSANIVRYPNTNNLNEAESRPLHQASLPIVVRPVNATHYSGCLHPSADNSCTDTVTLLPCNHAVLCPRHAQLGELCPKCNKVIEGVWNLF